MDRGVTVFSSRIYRWQLRPGDHIYAWRNVYSHHGIYESDDRIIHFTNGDATVHFTNSPPPAFHRSSSSEFHRYPRLLKPAGSGNALKLRVKKASSAAALTASWEMIIFASSPTECPRGSLRVPILVLNTPAPWMMKTPPRRS
ncbi:hypothetical protein DAI22_11g206200 [Oryza sativa Japonica Group]|nr:hypothetical protein DAI22_11g206200 [Oryza sativa Japonica Group]